MDENYSQEKIDNVIKEIKNNLMQMVLLNKVNRLLYYGISQKDLNTLGSSITTFKNQTNDISDYTEEVLKLAERIYSITDEANVYRANGLISRYELDKVINKANEIIKNINIGLQQCQEEQTKISLVLDEVLNSIERDVNPYYKYKNDDEEWE